MKTSLSIEQWACIKKIVVKAKSVLAKSEHGLDSVGLGTHMQLGKKVKNPDFDEGFGCKIDHQITKLLYGTK